ncbi:MAG: formate C-acetyltransferase [Firmicutes bacterium]|nr:formate C-acetyltransferase [Bacillota bacterium]
MTTTTKQFKRGNWQKSINVRDFIVRNYTPYMSGSEFLCGATSRTEKARTKMEELLQAERDKGGVLDVDTEHVSSIMSYTTAYLTDEDIIVGFQTDKPLKRGVNPFGGIRMAQEACKAYGYTLSDEVLKHFEYKTTHNDGVFRVYTDEMKKLRRAGVITGLPDAYGRGRIIGDYRRVALYGVDALIVAKKADMDAIGKLHMCEDNIRLREELFRQLDFLDKLKNMASLYGFDISRPAETAKEAVQWTYFGYLAAIKEQNGAAMSLGRVSSFFDIYFERDIKAGILTESQAQEIIDDFVIKLRMGRQLRTPDYNELFAGDPTWVTEVIGGIGLDGRPMVTKTSYRMLNTLYNLGPAPEPNLTVLWSKDLPQKFKDFCAKVSLDTSSIQYQNDDIMRPEYGDDYGIACCVSAMKLGEQMQFFGARCNLAKLLLMSLNGGRDEMTGGYAGLKMDGLGGGVLNYDTVKKRFDKYVKWLAAMYVDTMNVIHYMHDKYAYEKLQMALHNTDVERLMAFGIAGLSVVADSLSAIKYAKVTAIADDTGLITDYKVEGDYPKFGNDDDRADSIAISLAKDFYKALTKREAYRNAKHTLSLLTITSNVVYGAKTGATPCGRKVGEPFAPGANPLHGRECGGALASLNSVAKLDYKYCRDGISNTFSVIPNAIGREKETQSSNLAMLIEGYFAKGGHHINVNTLTKETLVEAHETPHKHPNLTVRVSGYAVKFGTLSRRHREEVLKRTFFEKL